MHKVAPYSIIPTTQYEFLCFPGGFIICPNSSYVIKPSIEILIC